MRTANLVAKTWPIGSAALADLLHDHIRRRVPRPAVYGVLNRMFSKPARLRERYPAIPTFHRLPRPTIGRFHAGRTIIWDVLRILSGRPLAPIHRTLCCRLEGRRRDPPDRPMEAAG